MTHKKGVWFKDYFSDTKMLQMTELDAILQTHGVTKEALKCVVDEGHRNEIAKAIGDSWESLATFIGISNVEVGDIKGKYREPLDRRLAMMRRWHELWGEEATYLRLVEGLRQIGRRDLIDHCLQCLVCIWQPATGSKINNRSTITNSCEVVFLIMNIALVVTAFSVLVLLITVFPKQPTPSLQIVSNSTTSTEQSLAKNITSSPQTINLKVYDHRILRNCSLPENDLPIIHPLFVGRENDMNQVLHKVATAHIVNINGAPGFGKSTLAIHIGYEIVKNGTSVQYINIEDKVFSMVNQISEGKAIVPKFSINTDVYQVPHDSLIKHSGSSLHLSRSQIHNQRSISENPFEELQRWSETIKCISVLILDNCDDILVTTFRHEFLSLIKSLVIKSNFKLHIIIVSREKLLYLDSFDFWTVGELSQSASVQMLDKLAPAIDNKSLTVYSC